MNRNAAAILKQLSGVLKPIEHLLNKVKSLGNERLLEVFIWVFLIFVGMVTFIAQPVIFSSDLKYYSDGALNLFLGKGYVDIDGSAIVVRTPLFPILMAMTFLVFGVSHISTFWMVKFFCVLNPLLIYVLGKRLFSRPIGVFTALLVLSSYAVDTYSCRHLDAVWPFFVLLSILFFHMGFEKDKVRYFLLGGLSLSLAYLTKEVAILFFPIPFLLIILIKEYRKKSFLVKVSWSYLVTFLCLLPWFVYLFFHLPDHGFIKILLEEVGAEPLGAEGLSIIHDGQNPLWFLFNSFKALFLGFLQYFHGGTFSLDRWFSLWPLLIGAWCYAFIGAFRGNRSHQILSILFILCTPLLFIQGAQDLRLGQSILFYQLSYLSIGGSIFCVIHGLSEKFLKGGKPIIGQSAVIIVLTAMVLGQISISYKSDLGYKAFFLKSQWREMLFGDDYGINPYGKSAIGNDKRYLDIIRPLSTPPNRLLIATTNRSLAYESYFSLKNGNEIDCLQLQLFKQKEKFISKEQPIVIKVNKRAGKNPHRLKAVYKSQLLEIIKKKKITHILVESFNRESGGDIELEKYFSLWSMFEKIPLSFEEISVYKVISGSQPPPPLPPVMNIRSHQALLSITKEKSQKNLSFLKKCFQIIFPTEQCLLEGTSIPKDIGVTKEKASSLFIKAKEHYQIGAFEDAIHFFKQAICVNPNLNEAYGMLFQALTILEYKQSIDLAPEDPLVNYLYGLFLAGYGLFDPSIEFYEKAIDLDSSYAKPFFQLGNVYFNMKDYDASIKALNQFITKIGQKDDPRKEELIAQANFFIGKAYAQLGDTQKAQRAHDESIRIFPNPSAYFQLGTLLYQKGNYAPAIRNFENALRLRSDFPQAICFLCLSYHLKGDGKRAKTRYKQLKMLDETQARKCNKMSGWSFE